jgi:hypothetical protein
VQYVLDVVVPRGEESVRLAGVEFKRRGDRVAAVNRQVAQKARAPVVSRPRRNDRARAALIVAQRLGAQTAAVSKALSVTPEHTEDSGHSLQDFPMEDGLLGDVTYALLLSPLKSGLS